MAGFSLRLSVTGTLGALCVYAAPAFAQEGGVQTTFGIEQGLAFGQNVGLDTPEGGNYAAADTRLSFGTISRTRTQSLSFGAATSLRAEYEDEETDAALVSPLLNLAYTQDAATASFSLSGSFQRREVDDLTSLSDFITDDGELELPADFDDLEGTGFRTDYDAAVALEFGIDRPIGLTLGLGIDGVDYEDTTSEELDDQQTVTGTAGLRFDLTPTFSTIAGLSYTQFEEDNDEQTDRLTREVSVGFIYEVSPRATVEATIGQTEIETTEVDGTTNSDAITGTFGIDYALPNGEVTADVATTLDVDGVRRVSLSLGRSMELPLGTLAYDVGVTQPDDGESDFIGSLAWTQDVPTGEISARLDRRVTLDEEDESRIETAANVNYAYAINSVSALNVGVAYALESETEASERVQQTDLSAAYSYALTEDWDFNTGVSYRIRLEDDEDASRSPLISFSIGREFTSIR